MLQVSSMTSEELSPGTVIEPGYRVNRLIGSGGMGNVWAATDLATGREVAIKSIPLATSSEERYRRLIREARVGMAFRHPNVVAVYDVVEPEWERPVVVMELLHGESLRALLTRVGRLSLGTTTRIMLPVISAVIAANELGIVHRDLKPDNIFLAQIDGGTVPKVLDFGIARLTASAGLLAASTVLTAAGALIGTLAYMAPEQLLGEPVDHLADIWSLGAILYECLSGGRPIEPIGYGYIVGHYLNAGITPLGAANPELATDVAEIVSQMLVRDRDERNSDLRKVHQVFSAHS